MEREKFNPFSSIDDLPDELRKELKISGDVENRILQILQEGGGTLNISEILVGYYKLFSEVKKRNYIASVLYRMGKKKLIFPTGKKGEYTTDKAKAKGAKKDEE